MAAKKSTGIVPEQEAQEIQEEAVKPVSVTEMQAQIEEQKRKIAELQKANEDLKRNSVYSAGPTGGESDWERVQRACMDAAIQGEDPWKIKISVKAPRIGKGEDSYWLSVNGQSIQVPANERYFELALPFAQCLVDEIRNRYKAADYIDSIENYDPDTNPKPAK